jgi:hypothetical protein
MGGDVSDATDYAPCGSVLHGGLLRLWLPLALLHARHQRLLNTCGGGHLGLLWLLLLFLRLLRLLKLLLQLRYDGASRLPRAQYLLALIPCCYFL